MIVCSAFRYGGERLNSVPEGYIFIFLSDIAHGREKEGVSLPYMNAIEGAVVKYI